MINDENLLIKCQHKIGCFKYIAVKQKSNAKLVPLQVYLEEVQINAKPYDGDTITVSAKYKVNYRGKTKWVNENEIYMTKEEIIKKFHCDEHFYGEMGVCTLCTYFETCDKMLPGFIHSRKCGGPFMKNNKDDE